MTFPELTLFEGLRPAERAALARVASTHSFNAGDALVREGDVSMSLYVVVAGRFEVVKRVRGSSREHRIHEIGPGEPVGEIGYFDRSPRSATVRALEPSSALLLPYDEVAKFPALVNALGERLAARLRTASTDELEHAQRRSTMGMLIIKIIMLLCGYGLLLAALPGIDLGSTSTSYLSLPIIAVFGIGAWRFMRATGTPMSTFGLGLRNFVPSLFESALLTPPFCALLVGLKALVVNLNPRWRGLPLIERPDWTTHLVEPAIVKLLVVYLVSAIVQELIVRSALQSSLEEFLVGPNARKSTLLACALMFSVNHLHMSFTFAALTFIPGIFWGWLFSRRRHLVGPVLSHFVVGAFVFFVLGVSLP